MKIYQVIKYYYCYNMPMDNEVMITVNSRELGERWVNYYNCVRQKIDDKACECEMCVSSELSNKNCYNPTLFGDECYRCYFCQFGFCIREIELSQTEPPTEIPNYERKINGDDKVFLNEHIYKID